jgi:predicted nucleotidyltransferase
MNLPLSEPDEHMVDWRHASAAVLRSLENAGLLDDSVVVLIGSYAAGFATPASDVDLLVLTQNPTKGVRFPPHAHVHVQTIARFKGRLLSADDYAISTIRFGKLLHDRRGVWKELLGISTPWPNWREKLPHAARSLRFSQELLAEGDVDAAAEEALYAATQLARSMLLRRGTYPKSRPELPAQLTAAHEPVIAQHLSRLMNPELLSHETLLKLTSSLSEILKDLMLASEAA